MEVAAQIKGRNTCFLLFVAGAVAVHFVALRPMFSFAWNDDTFSYIPLIPVVSGYFFYVNRQEIFRVGDGMSGAGALPILLAIALYAFGASGAGRLAPVDRMAIMTLSFVSCVVGGLGLFFGTGAWRAAAFPLFFLLFMVPIPAILFDPIVAFLQSWSADAAYAIFGLTGVPVYRDGFYFSLPGLSIEVAKECSGIRSSISLFLVSLVAGHLMLKDNWRKGVLALAVIPITVIKNAIRIFTLSVLAAYVDPRILGSAAHRRGGIPIFFLALVLLGAVLWLLRRGEEKRSGR